MAEVLKIPTIQVGLEESIARASSRIKPIKLSLNDRNFTGPLGRVVGQTAQFDKAITAATDRVVAFGAAAGAFYAVQAAVKTLVRSTVDVEQALARINVNMGESRSGLQQFSREMFNVAKSTGQTFSEAAKAAEELARQGLGTVETLKRLKDSLVLARLAGVDSVEAVSNLTAAYNTFRNEALDTTQIINKLVAVDTQFAVSTKDLSSAISRVGSTAKEAGVDFDQLLGIVTSLQQTTARGGPVIGNALKSIFTRVGRSRNLDDLEALGVGVKNLQGEILPSLQILKNLAATYDTVGQAQKNLIAEQVGGVFQINILKALLGDLEKQYNVVARATNIASGATDEAIRKNEQLNRTLAASVVAAQNTIEELFANLGKTSVNPLLNLVLDGINNIGKFLGETKVGEEAGKTIGQQIVTGISNMITGPGLLIIGTMLGKAFFGIFNTVRKELKSLGGVNSLQGARLQIEERIGVALRRSNELEKQQFQNAKTVAEQKRVILAIMQRTNAEYERATIRQRALTDSILISGAKNYGFISGRRVPRAAEGLLPAIAGEAKSIKQGVGGAKKTAKPVVIPNFNYGSGKRGTVVANTSEYIVPNFAGTGGSAIFNPEMIKTMGMPKGARKLAEGYVPNFAEEMLYHVTTADALPKILKTGISPRTKGLWKNKYGKSFSDKSNVYAWNNLKDANAWAFKQEYDLQKPSIILGFKADLKNFKSDFNSMLFGSGSGGIKIPASILASSIVEKRRLSAPNGTGKLSSEAFAKGYVPNFAAIYGRKIKERFAGQDIIGREMKTDAASNLVYSYDKALKEIHIDGMQSNRKGDAYQMFGKLLKIAKRGKMPIYSSSLLGQDYRIGQISPELSNFQNLLKVYPQLKYRINPAAQTSGNLASSVLKTKFGSMTELENAVNAIDGEKFRKALGNEVFRVFGISTKALSGGHIPNYANPFSGLMPRLAKKALGASSYLAGSGMIMAGNMIGGQKGFDLQSLGLLGKHFGAYVFGAKNVRTNLRFKNKDDFARYFDQFHLGSRSSKSSISRLSGKEALRGMLTAGRGKYKLTPEEIQFGSPHILLGDTDYDTPKRGRFAADFIIDGAPHKFVVPINESLNYALGGAFGRLRQTRFSVLDDYRFGASALNKEASLLADVDGTRLKKIFPKFVGKKIFDNYGYLDEKIATRLNSFSKKYLGGALQISRLGLTISDFDAKNLRNIARHGDRIERVEVNAPYPEGMTRYDVAKMMAKRYRYSSSYASGYIPNFANPLTQAIARERSAGIPASKIYIDKDARLKGPTNPAGLLVANRRDEPIGGFQGVNRVMRMGGNPKFAGIANGYVPNFAPQTSGPLLSNVSFEKIIEEQLKSMMGSQKQLRSRKGSFASREMMSQANVAFDLFKSGVQGGSYVDKMAAMKMFRKIGFSTKTPKGGGLSSFDTVLKALEGYEQQFKSDIAAQTAIQKSIARSQKKQSKAQEKIAKLKEKEERFAKNIASVKTAPVFTGESRRANVTPILASYVSSGKPMTVQQAQILAAGLGGSVVEREIGGRRNEEILRRNQDRVKTNKSIAQDKRIQEITREYRRLQSTAGLARLERRLDEGTPLTKREMASFERAAENKLLNSKKYRGYTREDILRDKRLRRAFQFDVSQTTAPVFEQNEAIRRERVLARLDKFESARFEKAKERLGAPGRFFGLGGSEKRDLDILKRAGIKTNSASVKELIGERKRIRAENQGRTALGLSFAASFAGGFVPQGAGGTLGGVLGGAGASGLTGLGLGALFGPMGIIAGGVGGALVGALGKAQKSLEELAQKSEEAAAAQNKNVDALGRFFGIEESIREAISSGNKAAAGRLQNERSAVLSAINDPAIIARLQKPFENEEERQKFASDVQLSYFKQQNRAQAELGLFGLGRRSTGTVLADKARGIGLGAANAPLVGVLDAFGFLSNKISSALQDPTEKNKKIRESAFSTAAAISNEDIAKIDRELLNRAITNQSSQDIAALTKQFQELGISLDGVEITTSNMADFAEILRQTTKVVEDRMKTEKNLQQRAEQEARKRPFKGAFRNASIFGEDSFQVFGAETRAKSLGQIRNTFQQRDSFLSFVEEIMKFSGAKSYESVFGDKGKQYIEEQTQLTEKDRALASAARYLQGVNPGGRYFDMYQKPIEQAVVQGLQLQSKSTDRERQLRAMGFQSIISAQREAAPSNQEKVEVYSGDKNRVIERADKILEGAKEISKSLENATIRAVLDVNGVVKLLSDTLSESELKKMADELTANLGKKFEAQIRDSNRRLEKLESNEPLPPQINAGFKAPPNTY